jgi:uncharacterized repeat protein (TIGR01451 family)
LAISSVGVALAVDPPPVQIYYVPAPEDQTLSAFTAIYPGNAACGQLEYNVLPPIETYISISVVADDTIIYYDHWEDDFEIDIANPIQPTTQIWGDGDPSNGAPPGFSADLLNPGDIIILDNPVDPATRQQVIDFDGGDKLGASHSIAMTRGTWADSPGTLLAGALEVYDTGRWGLNYTATVGENVSASTQLFEYSGLVIMASEDGTTVAIDRDADGAAETTVNLEEGESYLVNGGVMAGATVKADAPVQAGLITGDRCDTYESRWYALFPDEDLGNSYYAPMGTPTGNPTTKVFLHNPNASTLTINWTTTNGAETPRNVAAGGTTVVIVPYNSGAHFFSADGRPFSALAAVYAGGPHEGNARADWGFTLVPESELTAQVLVGWAPGKDPTSAITENGSPVWVTPVLKNGSVGPVDVCVDYNGDGQGPLVDSTGFGYDVLLTLNEFQTAKVFDPDGDQTGMVLYVCDGHVAANTAAIAVVWGQDPETASAAEPGLDLGTTAPPAFAFEAGKGAVIVDDPGDDSIANPGDVIEYAIVIRNVSRFPLPTVALSDTLPVHTTYVLSTTALNDGASVSPIPDSGVTPFPLDEGGITLPGLDVNGAYTVTFRVTVDEPFPPDVDRVRNQAIVTVRDQTRNPEVETPVETPPLSIHIEKATNGVDADAPTGPIIAAGDVVTWTYEVTTSSGVSLTNISVTDNITGVTPVFVSGDSNGDGVLDPDEIWLYEAMGVAVEGQYANIGTVTAAGPIDLPLTDTDPSHYFGVASAIHIEKTVDRPVVTPGETVVYSYTVSNPGNTPLADIRVVDDRCAPVDPVLNGDHNAGDVNQDDLLDVVELWGYTCTMTVTVPITNTATVTGTDVLSRPVTDTDTAFVDVRNPEPQVHIVYVPMVTNQHEVECPPPGGCPVDGLTYVKGLAVNETRNLLYITDRGEDRLLALDPVSFEVKASVATGDQPWGIAVNEQTGRVYVSNFGDGDVWIYDAATLTLLNKVNVGGHPALMDVIPDLDMVFVVVRDGSQIAVIQGETVVQTLGSGGSGPYGIAADPVHQRVFVGNRDSRQISLLTRNNGVWEAHAQVTYTVNTHLFELAYNWANQKLYAVYTEGGQWSVDVWKPEPGAMWGRYATVAVGDGGSPDSPLVGGTGLAVNPSTGRAFNVNTAARSLSVIDGDSNGVINTIGLGEDPFPIAVDSQRNVVYVGLRSSARIVVIRDE